MTNYLRPVRQIPVKQGQINNP